MHYISLYMEVSIETSMAYSTNLLDVNDYRTIIRKSFVIFVYRRILIEIKGLSYSILRNVL